MVGLLQQSQQTPINRNISPGNAPQQTPQSVPVQTPQGQGSEPPQSGDNTAEINNFIQNALKTIHTPQVSDGFINQIKQSSDKQVAVADATVEVTDRLINDYTKNKGKSPGIDTIAYTTNVIAGEVITLAQTSGAIEEFDQEQKAQAYVSSLSKIIERSVKNGNLPPESLAQMGKEAADTPEGQEVVSRMGAK